jgi:hypothetical protein
MVVDNHIKNSCQSLDHEQLASDSWLSKGHLYHDRSKHVNDTDNLPKRFVAIVGI